MANENNSFEREGMLLRRYLGFTKYFFNGYTTVYYHRTPVYVIYARNAVIFFTRTSFHGGAQKAICLLGKYLQRLTMREIVEKAIILEDCCYLLLCVAALATMQKGTKVLLFRFSCNNISETDGSFNICKKRSILLC